MKVDVYWNLHKNIFSVRHKGKVIDHVEKLLIRYPTFVVQQGGRRRVLETKQKNVHAFVRGYFFHFDQEPIADNVEQVTYNPYKYDSFVNKKDESIRREAFEALLTIKDGKPVIMAGD